jgi:serine/threonine protein kinase
MTQARAISHFLIERELGRGGMGVVYQGLDTRLHRPVAIKSLPQDVTADPRWRARFEAEARILAAVNHPNIAAIYGIESDDTGSYLILELAEGPTLDERLSATAPDIREALTICHQVALGIAAAHARGIIHRDLKPSNIKLRPDGVVKVLDFGIAKSAHAEGPVDPNQPTVIAVRVNAVSTIPGFMMGTPGYMAPEQARGRPVSQATDLWALGCVLYECLAHRMAFPGETLADAIAMTLLGQPEMSALPARTPVRIHKLLQVCLRKKQEERTLTMAQAAAILEDTARDFGDTDVLVRAGRVAAESAYEPELGNLPPFDEPLMARDELLHDLALSMKESRLVTLTGGAGVGATRLAGRAAQMHRASFRSGAWWVWLPFPSDPALPALRTAIAMRARGHGGGPIRALQDRIAERSMLLIMDGCSHSPAACAGLALDLLRACPNLQIVATARSPLGVPGELIMDVPPLPDRGPEALSAANLLIARARLANQHYNVRPEALRVHISGWFGGNPLAVELASHLLASMTLDAFESQLRVRAGLTDAAIPASLAPEQLCRVLASWAIDQLPPPLLAGLLRACVFMGPWSVRAAAAVGGAKESLPSGDSPFGPAISAPEQRLLDQLARLRERGLVQHIPATDAPTSPCFLLPEVVRLVALTRLRETPAAEAVVLAGYRAYVLALADQAMAHLSGPTGEAFAARLEAEYADLAHVAQAAGADGAAERVRATLEKLHALRGLA